MSYEPGSRPVQQGNEPAPPKPAPSIIDIITHVAKSVGVPPELALAIAFHESGLNPYAVGDGGTSFGLYQLHQGGELGSHSQAWADNVYNNALTALSEVAKVYKANPNQDWGQIAAEAQRPADPASYAASINSILTDSGSSVDWFAQQNKSAAQSFTPGVQQELKATAASGGTGSATGLTQQLTAGQLAAGLSKDGFVIGLIDHTPELKNVFTTALSKDWSIDETMAAIQNTQWYRQHSQAQQQFLEMQYQSPAQLQRKIAQTAADLTQMATNLGVGLSAHGINAIARSVVYNGLDQTEQIAALVKGFSYRGQGLEGQAASDIDSLKQLASQYYVGMSNQQLGSMAQRMMTGQLNPQDVQDFFKQQALAKFPHLRQQLDQGLTVADVASPYKAEYAKYLLDDPNAVDQVKNEDPTILKALQQSTPQGTQLMPVWQFQQMLKQDPRWLHTNNARDALMDQTTGLLQNMGLISGGVSVGALGSTAR